MEQSDTFFQAFPDMTWVHTVHIVAVKESHDQDSSPKSPLKLKEEDSPEDDNIKPQTGSSPTLSATVSSDEDSELKSTSNEQEVLEFVIHRELLEATSDFFRARRDFLSKSAPSSNKTTTNIPFEQVAPLKQYLKWLYGYRNDSGSTTLPWDHLLACFVFADEYQLRDFSRAVLKKILSQLTGGEVWIPSESQLKHIYQHTSESSGLRSLLADYVLQSSSELIPPLLRAAPSEFLLDYSIAATRELGKHFPKDSPRIHVREMEDYLGPRTAPRLVLPKSALERQIDRLGDVVNFTLADSEHPAVLHIEAFAHHKKLCPLEWDEIPNHSYKLPDVSPEIFKLFASWIYFAEQLSSDKPLGMLLRCCHLADCLQDLCDNPDDRLAEVIALRGSQFWDDIIPCIDRKLGQMGSAFSLEEVQYLYDTTDPESPLRQLFINHAIHNDQSMEIEHAAFQKDLIKGLFDSKRQLQSLCAGLGPLVGSDLQMLKRFGNTPTGKEHLNSKIDGILQNATQPHIFQAGPPIVLIETVGTTADTRECYETITMQNAYADFSVEELRVCYYEFTDYIDSLGRSGPSSSGYATHLTEEYYQKVLAAKAARDSKSNNLVIVEAEEVTTSP